MNLRQLARWLRWRAWVQWVVCRYRKYLPATSWLPSRFKPHQGCPHQELRSAALSALMQHATNLDPERLFTDRHCAYDLMWDAYVCVRDCHHIPRDELDHHIQFLKREIGATLIEGSRSHQLASKAVEILEKCKICQNPCKNRRKSA